MTTFRWVFTGLLLARGAGEVLQTGSATGWWLCAAALAAVVAPRPGLALAAVVAATSAMTGGTTSCSVVLAGWVAAALVLFDGEDLRHVLRIQAVVVYGFAAAHKAISPLFLSGYMLQHSAARGILWAPGMAFTAVVTEACLALAVWQRRQGLLLVAVPMHAAFVVTMAHSWPHALALAAFNGTMVALVWASGQARDRQPELAHAHG